MNLEEIRVSELPTPLPIRTPAEEPMKVREWVQAAVEIALLVTLVWPLWTLLGIILIGPATLLKKYSHCFSEEGQKRIDQFYAFTTEIFEMLSSGSKYPLAYCKKLENVEKKGRPILLVHGYLHNASGWIHFLKRLGDMGFGPVYTINLGHPFLPLSEYAKRIEAKAEEIRLANQRDDLVLIGHSMGGVVSSLYATKLAQKSRVTDVFTLGSPLAGSNLANTLGVGPSGRELRPGAPLLAEIRDAIQAKKETIRFYHAGSEADLLVSADSALSGCGKQLRVTDLGHMQFLTSEKILNWIKEALAQPLTSGF